MLWFDVWECLVCLVGSKNMVVAGETVARPVNLAQASQSRLGETNRDSPKLVCARGRSGDSLKFWASEHLAQARGVSPKRDPALLSEALFEPSLRRRGLAWARMSRLSEGLGETIWWLVVCLLSYDWNCLDMTAMMKYMYIYMVICLTNGYICMTWFINDE